MVFNLKEGFKNFKIIIIGIIIVVLYWIMETFIETFVFRLDSSFYTQQFSDDISVYNKYMEYRMWMRVSVIIPIVLFGVYAQNYINKRKKMNQVLKESKEKEIRKLKEIDQIKSDLLRRVSHELKTPLISIFSASQFLLNNYKGQMNEDILKFVEIINRGGERLKLLNENMLDAFNLESNNFQLNKQKEDIVKILKNCANDLMYSFKERDLILKVDLNGEFYVEVDKFRIEQVILNLLTNAIKNTPPKGFIYINLKKYEKFIEMFIIDTGVGFTEDEKEKIFKKFGKIERYGKGMNINTEGTGLGLFISKEIVDLHGGKIWVESEGRNKGSTFIVRLPIDAKENSQLTDNPIKD